VQCLRENEAEGVRDRRGDGRGECGRSLLAGISIEEQRRRSHSLSEAEVVLSPQVSLDLIERVTSWKGWGDWGEENQRECGYDP